MTTADLLERFEDDVGFLRRVLTGDLEVDQLLFGVDAGTPDCFVGSSDFLDL